MYLSILVPTFNSALTVGKMIESYVAENFSFASELIIIDNKSTDQTLEIIEHFGKSNNTIKLFSEKDGGISDAFNKGINHANGEYILILGSDNADAGWTTLFHEDASDDNPFFGSLSTFRPFQWASE